MNKDNHLIFENYVDGITRTRNALGGHIMSIVKYGIPSKKEFIKIRQELHDKVKEVEARGTPVTDEEREWAQEIIGKIKNYRSQNPNDPPPYENEESGTPEQYAKDMEKDYPSQKLGSEDAEDAESAEQKKERVARKWELNKQRWDKWKKENPEKAKLNAQRKAGIYGNKEENAEMPQKDFLELKKHINKGPIQIKKPSKELPYTHKYIHQLAKQDSREGQREENAENHESRMKKITDDWVNTFYRTFGPGQKEEMEKRGQDSYKFFVDYYIAFLKNPDIVNKFANIYNDRYPSNQIDLNRLHKEIDEIKDKPIEGYRAPSNRSENEERRIDPKCWKGYHKQGTKLKGGVRVNNCVKNS